MAKWNLQVEGRKHPWTVSDDVTHSCLLRLAANLLGSQMQKGLCQPFNWRWHGLNREPPESIGEMVARQPGSTSVSFTSTVAPSEYQKDTRGLMELTELQCDVWFDSEDVHLSNTFTHAAMLLKLLRANSLWLTFTEKKQRAQSHNTQLQASLHVHVPHSWLLAKGVLCGFWLVLCNWQAFCCKFNLHWSGTSGQQLTFSAKSVPSANSYYSY